MQNIRNPLAVILQTFFPQSQRTLKKDTWTLKGHSSETQALWRLKGTWALEVLEILYFADS